MRESRREELARNLFDRPAAEGTGAIIAGLLYDLVAFPMQFIKQRRRKKRRLIAEQAQAVRREARRLRREAMRTKGSVKR